MIHAMNIPALLAVLTPPSAAEYLAVVPGAIIALTAMIVILLDVVHRNETTRDYLGYVSAVGMGASLLSCWMLWGDTMPTPVFHGMLYADKFGLFFAGLSSAAGILAVLMSPRYLQSQGMDRGEYYMLILFGVLGMIFMANAADLLTLFIALEVMSIPIYTVAAFLRREARSAEAGLKYFILGAFSTAFMLYGIALIYGLTGTTNLEMVAKGLAQLAAAPDAGLTHGVALMAVLMVLSGFAFKLAAFPFHMWTPDVYTGSPTPAVGFMATGVKAAAIAALVRLGVVAFYEPSLRGGFFGYGWIDLLLFMAFGSVILGNMVAMAQTNVKRMLAYSSIAHAGYILVGVVAANSREAFYLYNDAALFYIVAYSFGTLGAFGALAYLSKKNGDQVETYEQLSGLGFKFPLIGAIVTISMLSSAGIPPTAGFLGKLYVFRTAVDVGAQTGEFAFIGLALVAILTSVAGVYYYLKVLVYLYMKPANNDVIALEHNGAKAALVIAGFMSLYLGIFPDRMINAAREAVVDMVGAPAAVQPAIEKGKALLVASEATPANIGQVKVQQLLKEIPAAPIAD